MTETSSGHVGMARSFATPDDSQEHRRLRKDLIEWGLLGSDGVYRYCFSRLSGKNGFAMDPTELHDEVRTFLSRELPKPSIALCIEGIQWDLFVAPYLRNRLHVVETGEPLPKRSKEDRAIDALLLDPILSDEDVRDLLKTTEKQMRRWSTYGILRRAMTRNTLA